MTASRKLAAILAADVVGYSRMMGEDEAGTASLVRERREAGQSIIAAHGGRLFKTMGDGMLIEFASVVAAVECALAMQEQMASANKAAPEGKRILYRIGVHLGDVLVEGEDILGDGVNIASRLEGVAEPGGVSISGAAHEHVRGRIEAEFIDLGEKALKNIARPVRVYAVRVEAGPLGAAPDEAPSEAGPPRLSIIVLPFANMSGDPEQEYFVDGVTESLTTDLSRIRGSFVIARNTAFTYRGKASDVTKIGRELNVRYALEGSVQRSGQRMRVNAQLLDAQNGSHLWAERFERPVTDLFEMQDEIVARIANTLNGQLIAAEARRAERAPTPDSLDLYFQGEAWVNRGVTFESLSKARGFFQRALALDPANVDALAGHVASRGQFRDQPVHKRQSRAVRRSRSRRDRGFVARSRSRSCAPVFGHGAWLHQPRHSGHRGIRKGVGAGSEHGRSARADRTEQAVHRSRRGDRGACSGSASPEPA